MRLFFLLFSIASHAQEIDPGIVLDKSFLPSPHFSNAAVLLIGIDQYKHAEDGKNSVFGNLVGAEKDIDGFVTLLEDFQATTQTKDGSTGLKWKKLKGRDVTLAKVIEAFDFEWVQNPQPVGLLFIVWAGHAMLDEDKQPYFMLYDSKPNDLKGTALSFNKFLGHFRNSGILASHRILVLDVCHSGSINNENLKTAIESTGSESFLLASTSQQGARDEESGGVFSQGLLRGLRGFGKDVRNNNLVITLQDAYSHAREEVERRNSSQTPLIISSNNNIELVDWGESCSYYTTKLLKIDHSKKHRAHRDLEVGIEWLDATTFDTWDIEVTLDLSRGTIQDAVRLTRERPQAAFQISHSWLKPGDFFFDVKVTLISKVPGYGNNSLSLPLPGCRQRVEIY